MRILGPVFGVCLRDTRPSAENERARAKAKQSPISKGLSIYGIFSSVNYTFIDDVRLKCWTRINRRRERVCVPRMFGQHKSAGFENHNF